MRTELVSIPTDTTPLDGLYHLPEDREVRGAVLLMHGNGMNFYTGPPRFLPPRLVDAGFACLTFNRRGHDTLAARTRRPEGNAFQTAAQAMADNELAGQFLAARGHPSPSVVGHSNGGLLASRYVADHTGTPALVLLSAHCGGREWMPLASRLGLLAGDRLPEFTRQAQELVADGRPDELMLLPGWWYVTSAASFLDGLTNVPSLLGAAPEIACPTLFVRGDREDREMYPAERFAERAAGPVDVRVLEDCDHFYTGVEDQVAALVTGWLTAAVADPGARTTTVRT
ncbi:MAG TPA: alpha/beta fold hydrolase [Modestobacter sp.]|nr:alpha/beta fold hydrolase [Modestobacter sp.]